MASNKKFLPQEDNNQYIQNFRGYTLNDASTTASYSPQTLATGSTVTLTVPTNAFGIQYSTQTDSEIDIVQGSGSFRIPNGFYHGITPNQTITLKNNSTTDSYLIWFAFLTL